MNRYTLYNLVALIMALGFAVLVISLVVATYKDYPVQVEECAAKGGVLVKAHQPSTGKMYLCVKEIK